MSASYLELAVLSISLTSSLFVVKKHILIKQAENYFSPTSPQENKQKNMHWAGQFFCFNTHQSIEVTDSQLSQDNSLLQFSHQLLCNFSHNSPNLLPLRVNRLSMLSFSSTPQDHISRTVHTHTHTQIRTIGNMLNTVYLY